MFERFPEFNPSCKFCDDLTLPDEIYVENIQTNLQSNTWNGYQYEFQASAKDCAICEAIVKSVSYFAKRAWDVDLENSRFVRIDVTIRIPGSDCAGIGVDLDSFHGTETSARAFATNSSRDHTSTHLYFELCPTEGTAFASSH